MKPSPDWSRGLQLGSSVTGSSSMIVEDQAEKIHLVWLHADSGQSYIRYTQLDETGHQVIDQDIQLPPGQLRMPRILPASNDLLHLLWANRENSTQKWSLWHVLLDQQGIPVSLPKQISLADLNVSGFTAIQRTDQSVAIFWAASLGRGLYGLDISPEGEVDPQQTLIAERGNAPSACLGADGDIHLSWVDDKTFFYTRFPDGQIQKAEGKVVTEVTLTTADSLSGPVLGLSDDWIYLIWSIERQSGMEAGTGRTEYIAFPMDQPTKLTSKVIWILPAEEQPYQPYQGAYNLTTLAEPTGPGTSSDYIFQPAVSDGQRAELAAALAVRQEYRRETHVQIAVLIFEDGKFKGYEFASKTKAISSDPILVSDNNNALHLVWRQGAMGRDIYYATTAAESREELDRVNSTDVINAVFTGGMESFVGVLFFPWIGFGWLLPGMIVLGINKVFKDNDAISRSSVSFVLLVVAILVYQGVKLISLPSITFYVPFSAWIEIPSNWRTPLTVAVPLVILVCAFLFAMLVRRKRTDSAMMLYIAFVLVDAIFTLAIYGVGFLGVY